MARKRSLLMLATALPVVAAMAGTFAPVDAKAQELMERHFNVVGSWSTSSLYPDHEEPFWNDVLPEESGGKLTADVQAFDVLGLGGAQVYELVQQGVYDSGATVIDYVAGEDPRFEGLDLPAIADPAVSRQIAEAYRPTLEEAFDETYDSELVAVVPFTSQVVFCNAEINGLDDLEGKRIRGSGRMTMDFIEAVGATGVSLSFNEVPVALERGVVDCGITGSLSGYLAGWSEVATHFYPLPTGGWDHIGIVFSNSVWNELDEPTQAFLEEQFAALEERVWAGANDLTQVGIDCNTGGECSYGDPETLTLVEVTEADQERAIEVMEADVLPSWAERCSADCISAWNDSVGEVLGISAN